MANRPNSRFIISALAVLLVLPQPALAQSLPWVERLEGGSGSIQNSGNSSYRPARVGTRIRLDEAVLPGPRTRMVVRCPNNTRSRAVPGRRSGIGLVCPDVKTVRRSRGDSDILDLRRGSFPYEPGIASARPTFAWPPLAGAQFYRVELYRRGNRATERLWWAEVSNQTVSYNGLELEPGQSYSLVVTPGGAGEGCGFADWRQGRCSQSNFRRLTAAESALLAEATAATEGIGGEEKLLALAYAYGNIPVPHEGPTKSVIGDVWAVIDLLAPLVAVGEQPPAVYALLGESYLRAGWFDQAQEAFATAEYGATLAGDYRTRLEARLGLAKVALWQQREDQAESHVWSALGDASALEDWDQANILLQLLRKLG